MSSPEQQQQALASVESTARASAIKALEERGVINAAKLVGLSTPVKVLGWCRWWDTQRGVGVALLVDRIRSGEEPPAVVEPDSATRYIDGVVDWLHRKMPEVFAVSAAVVKATRTTYGDVEAKRLESSAGPHPAAVAAVIRLHHSTGGKLTVKEHGPTIRAAVREFDERAVSDLEAIAVQRRQSIEMSQGTAA